MTTKEIIQQMKDASATKGPFSKGIEVYPNIMRTFVNDPNLISIFYKDHLSGSVDSTDLNFLALAGHIINALIERIEELEVIKDPHAFKSCTCSSYYKQIKSLTAENTSLKKRVEGFEILNSEATNTILNGVNELQFLNTENETLKNLVLEWEKLSNTHGSTSRLGQLPHKEKVEGSSPSPCTTDTERLEWMIDNQKLPELQPKVWQTDGGWYLHYRNVYFKTPREAIDAAMKESK